LPKDESSKSSAQTVVAIVATVFLIEAAVMSGLVRLIGETRTSFALVVLDAALLSVITAPIIYYLVRAPVRRELERRLEAETRAETMGRLAVLDALTGTLNRRGIMVALLEAMAYAERYEHPLTVALADIDRFKQVNDRFGHEAGDRVLEGLAEIFRDTVRQSDQVGRYGGEEFLFVFPETTLEASQPIVERIRARASERRFHISSGAIAVTVSIGVTQFEPSEEHGRLLSRVDQAMYQAKRSGRNLVVVTDRRPRLRAL
jgi:diguanylate cyclase